MNKKQLGLLVATLVLSTQATINENANDNEPAITEDEARTLLAMKLRRASTQLVADAAGVETADVIIEEAVAPVKKAKEPAETSSTS